MWFMKLGGGVNGRVSSGRQLVRALAHPAQALGGVAHHAGQPADLAQVVAEGRAHQLRLGWARDRWRTSRGRRARLQVHAARHQVGRRHAVGQRVVDLAEHGDPAVGQALDEVHLPQRPAAVQRRAGDLADGVVELAPAAGAVHPVGPDVVLEVDLAVLPPHRVVELERDVDQLVAERVELVEPAVDDLAEVVDAERAGPSSSSSVDDRELQRVHVHGRRFAVQQYRVPPAEPLHAAI